MGRRPARRFKGPPGPGGPVVLGLETGEGHLGVALWRLPEEPGSGAGAWRLLEARTSHRGSRHANAVLGAVHDMLQRHELGAEHLGLVGAGRGPGGFTGVRVGLSTAVGIALGLGVPVWPVDSLASLACHAAGVPGVVAPLFDARKGEVYGGGYRVPAAGVPEAVAPPRAGRWDTVLEAVREEAGEPTAIFGSGALAFACATEVPPSWHVPSAVHVGWLAARAWEEAGRDASAAPPADPVYLRPSEAERKLEESGSGGG